MDAPSFYALHNAASQHYKRRKKKTNDYISRHPGVNSAWSESYVHADRNLEKALDLNLSKLNLEDMSDIFEIGAGTFSSVFKVSYNGQAFALKQVYHDYTPFPYLLWNERDALLTLRDKPSILQIKGAFLGIDVFFLLELCIGNMEDLLQFLEDDLCLVHCLQLLEAVFHVHSCRILHRDIKTANVLLQTNGNIALADFGAAVMLKPGCDTSAESLIVSTYAYSPVEILKSTVRYEYSYATDVFAAGVTCLEFFYKQRILRAKSNSKDCKLDIINYQTNGVLLRGSSTRKLLCELATSHPLESVVSKMVLLDSADRPQLKQIMDNSHIQRHFRNKELPVHSDRSNSTSVLTCWRYHKKTLQKPKTGQNIKRLWKLPEKHRESFYGALDGFEFNDALLELSVDTICENASKRYLKVLNATDNPSFFTAAATASSTQTSPMNQVIKNLVSTARKECLTLSASSASKSHFPIELEQLRQENNYLEQIQPTKANITEKCSKIDLISKPLLEDDEQSIIATHCNKVTALVDNKERLMCEKCGRTFGMKKNLKQHEVSVHGKKRIACLVRVCTQTFTRQSSLKLHVLTRHKKVKPYKCLNCPQTFSSRQARINHQTHCRIGLILDLKKPT